MGIERERFKRSEKKSKFTENPSDVISYSLPGNSETTVHYSEVEDPIAEVKKTKRVTKLKLKGRVKKFRFTTKSVIILLCVALLVSMATISYLLIEHNPSTSSISPSKPTKAKYINFTPAKVPFTPVVPATEPQLASLGSKNYNAAHQSYFFNDLYLGVPITVSEQPLPTGYSNTQAAVSAVAQSVHASNSFYTDGGFVFINTDPNSGKQVLVFSKSNLVIFIQSSNTIQQSDWEQYIASLE